MSDLKPLHSILYFNAIHVIESLRVNDEKTGQNLFSDTLADKPSEYPNLHVDLATPVTESDFWDYIYALRDKVVHENYNPIVHIEAHGDAEGIQLSSDECIDWHHLISVLTEMNVACNMNLLVCMSACKGGYFTHMVSPISRAPVFGIVGPLEDIDDIELENGFGAFYNTLLSTFNVREALTAMKAANVGVSFNYDMSNAREIFHQSYLHYKADTSAQATYEEREAQFIEVARSSDTEARYYLDSELRKLFRRFETPESREASFEAIKRSFFMCDLYPDNYERFHLGDIRGEA